MVDVAANFQVQVGTAGMVASVGSVSGIVFGLLMAVVSIRYDHKKLLLAGIVCNVLAALGYYLAPTFPWLLAANIAVGAGLSIVIAMTYAIIGNVILLKNRGRAIGIMVASTTTSFVTGALLVGVLSAYFDWRMVTLILSLPVALASLVLSAAFVPKNTNPPNASNRESFSAGCRQAFACISGVAALAVTTFMFCEGAIGYYSVSFLREQFSISIALGSTYFLVANIVSAVGGAVAGLMVNRVGRKRLGTIALVLACILTLVFTLMPTVEFSILVSFLRYWFGAMAATAGGSLIIEQLPRFRSTMSSLNAVFMNIGMLLASIIGGLTLNNFDYQALGMVLGGLGVLGAVVWVTLVKEPCPTTLPSDNPAKVEA